MFDMLVKRVFIQPAIPISSVYQLVYRPDPPKRNTHVKLPKLCKSFKNSILVNPVQPGFTLPTELRCPKCPYL
jgi:hypothetical protein